MLLVPSYTLGGRAQIYSNISANLASDLQLIQLLERTSNVHPHSSVIAWRIPGTGEVWWAAVHGVAKSRTRLSDFTFHFQSLEKEMATHPSVLAWRIPGTGEAWWVALYGVAQSRTQPKWLSSSNVHGVKGENDPGVYSTGFLLSCCGLAKAEHSIS